MLQTLLIWWFFVIHVEAVTEIIVDSDFFFPIRNSLGKAPSFVGKFFTALLSCGYCVSVWVAASVAWMLPGSPASHAPIELPIEFILIVDAILKTFVLHRLSNLQHEFMVRVLKRIPFFNPPAIVDNQEIIVEDTDDDQTGNKESNM
jgi:hypothetical protein